ncbi:Uncharacterised protein r2_g4115 [Pycnogonum litorale]
MKIEESLSSATELRLIPEFDGSGIQSVVEWFDKAELVCRLRGLSKPECVIPLRLTGGAFAVYQQLSVIDKGGINKIKASLYAAFAADSFLAYEQFVSRKLRSGESVDVFLAALRNLSFTLGGLSDNVLACAFVAGLPETVRQMLRASSRMEVLSLAEILARARAIMADECEALLAAGTVVRSPACQRTQDKTTEDPVADETVKCYEGGLPNRLARDCLRRRRGKDSINSRRCSGKKIRCYKCQEYGHIASSCPGNEARRDVVRTGLSPQAQ